MSDDFQKRNTADWAPGTLDKTRQNIGPISAREAAEMSKKLGGEVMYERSSHSSLSQKKTGKIIRQKQQGNASSNSSKNSSENEDVPKRKSKEMLPNLPKKVVNAINKVMMSSEFKIKPNYGIFNFVLTLSKNGSERIIPNYFTITMKSHITAMETFTTTIKTLIQISPSTYKAKIVNEQDPKFKFLRMVAGWSLNPIKQEYNNLLEIKEPLVVADLIPFVRAIYKPLLTVYYFGDTKIAKLIKDIYADECAYPDAPKDRLSDVAKQAITQWLYIDNEIIRKMYPLLMRMCSDNCYDYVDFFQSQIASILKFEGLHKFDLLLPEKQKVEAKQEEQKKPVVQQLTRGIKDEIVITGLKLLDQFFPEAGFSNLESHPDFFPYFQPIYNFNEGFNMLSPENPLQFTLVLLRIIEDCFHGLRNIQFIPPETEKPDADTIIMVMDDWSAYREDVFDRLYCEPLKSLVNQIYSKSDFGSSQFGKKLYTSLLWQTTYHFLPSFKFDQLLLDRPTDDSKYKQLFYRTDFVRKYLTQIVKDCDKAAPARGNVVYVKNPWDHYVFDLPNEISKRLDVLLGGKNTSINTNANNANLLKYTLCFVSVLDWWCNNPESPAYTTDPMNIFRISPEDGKPQFSVPERNDQNKLFAEAVKAAYMKSAK